MCVCVRVRVHTHTPQMVVWKALCVILIFYLNYLDQFEDSVVLIRIAISTPNVHVKCMDIKP